MSIRLPGVIRLQCRKITVLDVFTITNLIIFILIDIQVCSAGCCHERSFFHVTWQIFLIRILDDSLARVLTIRWLISDPFPFLVCPYYPLPSKSCHGLNFRRATALSTPLLTLLAIFFPRIWFSLILTHTVGPTVAFQSLSVIETIVMRSWYFVPSWASLPITKAFKESFNWLRSFLSSYFFLRVKQPNCPKMTEPTIQQQSNWKLTTIR